MDNILEELNKYRPISIENFEIIQSPKDFHSRILEKAENAKVVYLACLVFGSKEHSIQLLNILEKRLKNKQKTEILMDMTRNLRNDELIINLKKRGIYDRVKMVDMRICKLFPYALNEFLGIFHDKVYIFDDEVCISGANLEDTYFTNRIDRYFYIKNEEFAKYMCRKTFNEELVLSNDSINIETKLKMHVKNSFSSSENLNSKNSNKHFECAEEQESVRKRSITSKNNDTYIFHFDRAEESDIMKKLLSLKYNSLTLCTAYLNFPSCHLKLLKDKNFNLITASPETNTFNNFSFLGTFITETYKYSNYKTKTYLPNVNMFEYLRPEYTFHSKGLWLFNEDYCVTIIGSTNFNQRSVYVDKESNWVIISKNREIMKKLEEEVNNIQKYSIAVTLDFLRSRPIRIITILIYHILNIFI